MIKDNYRMLYSLLQKLFFFPIFVFNINRKTTYDFFKNNNFIPRASFMEERSPNPFPFLSKKIPRNKVESLKSNVLNNINIKNKTWKKVVNIVSLKSSLPRPLRAFSIVFSCIRKSKGLVMRSVNPTSISQSIPCSHLNW